MMKTIRRFAVVVVVFITTVFALSFYGKRDVKGTFADAELGTYDEAMTIAVTVTDANGNPVSGVSVASDSHSGMVSGSSTDANGVSIIHPGETEVLGLHVSGKKVWHSPYEDNFLKVFFLPSCEDGLSFKIKLK